VARLGLLGPAQPHGLKWVQPKKKLLKNENSSKIISKNM
jgi:hypothetical protein